MPKDNYVLSPIMINDNVMNLTVAAENGRGGQADDLTPARPQTAAYPKCSRRCRRWPRANR